VSEATESAGKAAGTDAKRESALADGSAEPRMGARLEARGLCRRFGPHRALNDLDLTIEPGETFGLLGANGAGKTTFIRLATGYLIPSAGTIEIDGISSASDPRRVQSRLGYVPETPRLYPELRVSGFLRFAAGLRGMRRREAKHAVERVLARFRLEDVAGRLIGHLSKGYRQRVSLAQAFLHEPSLLIVDEPTSGLDPLQRAEVREIIAELRGKRTILLCTHDLDEARTLTSRVAVLHRGDLVARGEAEALLADESRLDLFRGVLRGDLPGAPSDTAGNEVPA
jgi:ABC-2 type transport system ATP-binding protein